MLRVATEAQPDSSIRVLNSLFDVEIGELDGHVSERIEAAAAGYPLEAGRRQGLESVVTDADSKLTSSLSRDLLAGRPTEVEPVLGDLAARARAADVPVPLITASAVALRIHNRRLAAA